jgi:6-phosphofructokinase 1
MKRIGILTAGGDTPALNATIHGAVVRAGQLRLEIYGFIKGFSSLLNPRLPHVRLNPLMREIPELDATLVVRHWGPRAIICPATTPSR